MITRKKDITNPTPPQGSKGRKSTMPTIQIRATDAERADIERRAAELGISVPTYIRRHVPELADEPRAMGGYRKKPKRRGDHSNQERRA